MTNSEMIRAINDTVIELQNKIQFISGVVDGGDERIIAVKQKTVEVLESVLKKVSASSSELSIEDIYNGMETIDQKSRELYENALKKIEELRNDKTAAGIMPETHTQDYQNASANIHENSTLSVGEVSRQAIEIIKGWLIPEGEQR